MKATRRPKAARPVARKGKGTALAEYERKRDFTRTPEPRGSTRKSGPALAYVIQKHEASRLHFDLRLEVDGVMKSWAVPRGPSTDPTVKRLAVQVEDHPIGYNTFEGTIPEGEYGGGTVMIWDVGTWAWAGDATPVADAIRAALVDGVLEFVLHGKRLKGRWTLVRTRKVGRAQQWLLIKQRDRYARAGSDITGRYLTSAVSRRTMLRIAEER